MDSIEDIKRRAGITESAVTDANAVFQAVQLIDLLLSYLDPKVDLNTRLSLQYTLRQRNLQPRKIKETLTKIAQSFSEE